MFEQVKQEIDDKIKTNGNNEITATRLNGVLQDMMDASAEVIGEVQQSIGDQVEANPTGEATETLEKIKIGETIYTAPQGPAGPQGATGATGPQGAAVHQLSFLVGVLQLEWEVRWQRKFYSLTLEYMRKGCS